MGQAFAGTGEDLQRIIDTGDSFINEANDNFDVTTALIRDSNTVLRTQVELGQRDPQLRQPDEPVQRRARRPDPALRDLIDSGSAPRTSCAPSSSTTRSTSAS